MNLRAMTESKRHRAAFFALFLILLGGCSRPPPDASCEGTLKLWIERMESSIEQPKGIREASELLGPRTLANLDERARRASQALGRQVQPSEMVASGRFGLHFRVKQMRTLTQPNGTFVEVTGDGKDEHALVECVRVGASARLELPLPDPPPLFKATDGGL